MLYQLIPLLTAISTLATSIPPSLAVKQLDSRGSDFTFNLNVDSGVRIRLEQWPSYPNAQELARKQVVSGPIAIRLEGVKYSNLKYVFTKWTDMPEGTVIDECTVLWNPNGPNGVDAEVRVTPSSWSSNEVMTYSCVGMKLDPASGPYITVIAKDLEFEIIDPPMFGGERIKSGDQAIFKGLEYMKRDHIKIRLYSAVGEHECDFGTMDGQSQSRDLTWTLTPVGGANGPPVIQPSFDPQDHVGVGCKAI